MWETVMFSYSLVNRVGFTCRQGHLRLRTVAGHPLLRSPLSRTRCLLAPLHFIAFLHFPLYNFRFLPNVVWLRPFIHFPKGYTKVRSPVLI